MLLFILIWGDGLKFYKKKDSYKKYGRLRLYPAGSSSPVFVLLLASITLFGSMIAVTPVTPNVVYASSGATDPDKGGVLTAYDNCDFNPNTLE